MCDKIHISHTKYTNIDLKDNGIKIYILFIKEIQLILIFTICDIFKCVIIIKNIKTLIIYNDGTTHIAQFLSELLIKMTLGTSGEE